MADPWTEAWEEAQAVNSEPTYVTLEVQHPAFDQPLRIVGEVTEDVVLTLEPGAIPNGGEAVTFSAIPFRAERPEVGEGQVPQCTIVIDNVARELLPHLQAAAVYRADMIVILREWLVSDPSAPCFGPAQFIVRSVKVFGASVTAVASLDNLGNKKFPTRNYTLAQFPGLSPNG